MAKNWNKNSNINGLCLILLSEIEVHKEKTGYELTRSVPNTSHQQIYRELAKMELAGHLSYVKVAQMEKPDKKVYRIAIRKTLGETVDHIIQNLPVNSHVSPNDLEGVYRCVKYASPIVVIDWIDKFLSIYTDCVYKAKNAGVKADHEIRKAYVSFAHTIRLAALAKAEEEAAA